MTKCKYCEEYKKEGYTCDSCDAFICELCAEEKVHFGAVAPDDINTFCENCFKKEGEIYGTA